MMAVRAGAGAVYACEVNETMADLSRDVIAANRMSDNVTVIRAHSSCLTVPEDIPRRCVPNSVYVCVRVRGCVRACV